MCMYSDKHVRCAGIPGRSAGPGPAHLAGTELVQRHTRRLQHGAGRRLSAHEALHLLSTTSPRPGLQLGVSWVPNNVSGSLGYGSFILLYDVLFPVVWIRIRGGKNDPQKKKLINFFEVLDVLSWGLKAFPVACKFQFLIKKIFKTIFSFIFFLQFLVIKSLDPDPYPDPDSLEMLGPDPYPDPDYPKLWLFLFRDFFFFFPQSLNFVYCSQRWLRILLPSFRCFVTYLNILWYLLWSLGSNPSFFFSYNSICKGSS